MKLLIIEDSETLRRSIVVGLNNLGFTLDEASDGATGLSMALSNDYDLIILDLMLPNVDGMSLLKMLRQQKRSSRVLILSAKNVSQDKVDALMQGADDYLTKPFSFEELHARILALSRRGELKRSDNVYQVGSFRLDLDGKLFYFDNSLIDLTRNEFKILECLFSTPGRVFSIEVISESVAGSFDLLAKNTIEAHLYAIRKKVKHQGGTLPIKNKRGFGYFVEI